MTVEPIWIEWTNDYVYAMAAFPPEPCWRCGQPTAWIDFDFEVRLCPSACSEAAWLDFEYARQAGGPA